MSGALSTHVLDTTRGIPGADIAVRLDSLAEDGTTDRLAESRTDSDGRIAALGPDPLPTGRYRLTFGTGDYFESRGDPVFYPIVVVTVDIEASRRHYHVPLLLSPYAYSTYRGS